MRRNLTGQKREESHKKAAECEHPIEVADESEQKKSKKRKKSTVEVETEVSGTLETTTGKKKKSRRGETIAASDTTQDPEEKKRKKSKHTEEIVIAGEIAPEPHRGEENSRKKKKAKKNKLEVLDERTSEDGALETKSTKKAKRKRTDFEIAEDGTRLNVDVELLKEIRGPKLARSKAPPLRDLTDEQIQEIYGLWTSGRYAEFMRKVHSGELPRWVAVEKAQLDRMVSGRAKLIDLADVREVLQTKWKSASVDEIWGYTNLAFLAV